MGLWVFGVLHQLQDSKSWTRPQQPLHIVIGFVHPFVCYLTPTPGVREKRGRYGLQPGASPLPS